MDIKSFYTGMLSSTDTTGGATIDDEEGTCDPADCGSDEDVTDTNGNISIEQSVTAGNEIVQYAWVGDDAFDSDDVTHVTVTLTAMTDAAGFTVKSDIDKNADANTVDVDLTASVTLTVQLNDGQTEASDVEKPGVSISVTHTRGVDSGDGTGGNPDGTTNPDEVTSRSTTTIKTDDSGQATFTVNAPSTDPDANDDNVLDAVVFDGPGDNDVTMNVIWRDDNHGTANKLAVEVPDYALIYLDEGNSVVDGSATVTLYDMYGNTAGTGLRIVAQIDGEPASPAEEHGERVNSRGQAKFSRKGIASAGNPTIEVDITNIFERGEFDTNMLGSGADQIPDITTNPTIPVVGTPTDDEPALNAGVSVVLADEDKFIATPSGGTALLYSYDSDDTFIDEAGNIVDMDKFESELQADIDDGTVTAGVDVVVYDDDGSSIFQIDPQ